MHALFLIAFILCDRGDEAVTTSPLFLGEGIGPTRLLGAGLVIAGIILGALSSGRA